MPALPAALLNVLTKAAAHSGANGKEKQDKSDQFSTLLDIGNDAASADARNLGLQSEKKQKIDESRIVGLASAANFIHSTPISTFGKSDVPSSRKADNAEEAHESHRPEIVTVSEKRVLLRSRKEQDGSQDETQIDEQPNAPAAPADEAPSNSNDVEPVADTEAVQPVEETQDAAVPVEDTPVGAPGPGSVIEQMNRLLSDLFQNLQAVAQGTSPMHSTAEVLDSFFYRLELFFATGDIGPNVPRPPAIPSTPVTGTTPVGDDIVASTPVVLGVASGDAVVPAASDAEAFTVAEGLTTLSLTPEESVAIDVKAKLQDQVIRAKSVVEEHPVELIKQETKSIILDQLANVKQLLDNSTTDQLLGKSRDAASLVAQQIAPTASLAQAVAANPATANNSVQTPTNPVAVAQVGENTNSNRQDTGSGSRDGFQQTQTLSPLTSSLSSVSDKQSASNFARVLQSQAGNAPVLEQVVFHIKTALKDGSSKISIQLNPAELGKLEIKLHLTAEGKTGVVVTADNKDTLSLLQKDSSGLERALADAGLKTDSGSLSFNLRGGQQERDPEHSHAAGNYLKSLAEEEELLPTNVINRSYVVNLAEGLDIKI